MYVPAGTIEEPKRDVTKSGYPVDGLPATVYRGITAASAVGIQEGGALWKFLNFDYDFRLQRLPEKEVPC
jgi:hypothetical protein